MTESQTRGIVASLVLEVSVVGESLIPLVDFNRILTAGTLNSSDSVPCNVMPLVYQTVRQYATGPSSTILVLTRGSSRK